MRGLLAIVAIVGVSALSVLAGAQAASAVPVSGTSGYFTFSADDSDVAAGATVVGFAYTGPSDLVIPSSVTLNGTIYAVTGLAPFAFISSGLTTAVVPDSVTDIGQEAFGYNPLLTSVSLGNSVTSIGEFAFVNDGLTTLTIPDSVTVIQDVSFYGNSLTAITIPASVTSIEGNAFADNPLTSVVFEGAAPLDVQDVGSGQGSFGTGTGMTLTYPWRFGDPQTADGFTSPTWLGYSSQAMTTVSFDLAGHGAAITPQVLTSGGVAVEPLAPTAVGWTFTGWFADPAQTTVADFGTPVTADETLTAGWLATGTLPPTGTSSGPAGPAALTVLIVGVVMVLVGHRRRRAVTSTTT